MIYTGLSATFAPALPLAAMAFRRGWVMLLALAVLPVSQPAEASLWDDLWLTKDQQAQRQLDAGEASEAAALFDDPEWQAVYADSRKDGPILVENGIVNQFMTATDYSPLK